MIQTTTTQDHFHVLRGHVHDGCTVHMNNGDILTIKSTLYGWVLMRDGEPVEGPWNSARAIEEAIVFYGE